MKIIFLLFFILSVQLMYLYCVEEKVILSINQTSEIIKPKKCCSFLKELTYDDFEILVKITNCFDCLERYLPLMFFRTEENDAFLQQEDQIHLTFNNENNDCSIIATLDSSFDNLENIFNQFIKKLNNKKMCYFMKKIIIMFLFFEFINVQNIFATEAKSEEIICECYGHASIDEYKDSTKTSIICFRNFSFCSQKNKEDVTDDDLVIPVKIKIKDIDIRINYEPVSELNIYLPLNTLKNNMGAFSTIGDIISFEHKIFDKKIRLHVTLDKSFKYLQNWYNLFYRTLPDKASCIIS